MRTLALPKEVEHWSLTTLREKLVKIGAKVVRHGRYVIFQLAEVAVPRSLFQKILGLIDDLRRRPVPAWAGEIHGEAKNDGRGTSGWRKTGPNGLPDTVDSPQSGYRTAAEGKLLIRSCGLRLTKRGMVR